MLHDYTHNTYKSGWAITEFKPLSAEMVRIGAFGLKRNLSSDTFEDKYLLPGEEMVISMPDGAVLYKIVEINYRGDPYDKYDADIKYIQHLSGLRIIGLRTEEQYARALEWGRRYNCSDDQAEDGEKCHVSRGFPGTRTED